MAARVLNDTRPAGTPKPHRIFLWRSRSRDDLRTTIDRFRNTEAERPWEALIERPGQGRMDAGEHRLAVVAEGAADLDDKLAVALRRLEGIGGEFAFPRGIHYRCEAGRVGKVAFMFPGQGSHRLGMVEALSRSYPGADEFWETADTVLEGRLDQPLSKYVFPEVREGSATGALTETDIAQPAIGTADAVMHHVLTDLGIGADMCIGHSYGEYAALYAAGALSFEDLIKVSAARGGAVRQACRGREGAMLALGVNREAAERLVSRSDGIVVANVNGPAQTVVSGTKAEVDCLFERCADEGVRATRLDVAAAFHSPLLQPARNPLRRILDETPFSRTRIPVYSNTTGEPYPVDPESMKDRLVDHLTMAVHFMDGILNMHRDGARVFVEVGPGSTLAGLAGNTLKETAIVAGVDHRDGVFGLLNALARLFVAGVPWSLERLQAWMFEMVGGRGASVRQQIDGGVSGKRSPARVEGSQGVEAWPSDVHAAMQRHQSLMRLFVESQAKVMIRYLGRRDALAPVSSKDQGAGRLAAVPLVPIDKEPEDAQAMDAARADSAGSGAKGTILDELRSVVASLTGYPADILDADLDLESDLGIDSIKRVEILAELMERSLGLAEAPDDERRGFARLTTLAQMAEYLRGAAVGSSRSGKAVSEGASGTVLVDSADTGDSGAMRAPRPARHTIEWRDSRIAANGRLREGTVIIAGPDAVMGDTLGAALHAEHSGLGAATPDELHMQAGMDDVVGYVHLGSFRAPATARELCQTADAIRDDLVRMISNLQALEERLRSSRGFVVVATEGMPIDTSGNADANPLAGGHVGALKSLAHEWPEVDCRAVEIPRHTDIEGLAHIIVSELGSDDKLVEVSYQQDQRRTPVLRGAEAMAGPAEDRVQLDEGDVLLVTGGARGITAEVASVLAAHWRPVMLVVGRTVATEVNDSYCGISDMAELKREIAKTLAASGEPVSAPSIEATYRSIVRQREVAENLRRLRDLTGEVHYTIADVGDGKSLDRVVAEAYRRFGRIDGVVHGAGVIEDRLISDKDMKSFERVLRPKVDGALALVGSLRLDELKFLCFFSSTAALLGNAGQCDYAAANETLNRLARWLNPRVPARVFSMIWGPWEPEVGMVDDLLARGFAKRGISLIGREEGAAAFVDEVRLGAKEDAEVVFG